MITTRFPNTRAIRQIGRNRRLPNQQNTQSVSKQAAERVYDERAAYLEEIVRERGANS
jgi:hypothetical protein